MTPLKIISFNIHKGFGPGNLSFTLKKIKRFLAEENADIVFLQEVVGEHTGKKIIIPNFKTNNQVQFLTEGLYPFSIYGANKIHGKGHHGNAILSKFPLFEVNNHDISQNKLESRGLLHVKVDFNDSEIHLFNTHLNLLENHRKKQIGWINEHINKELEEHHPVILAGDFNDWRRKIVNFLHQETTLREVFGHLNGNHPNSFPSFLPRLSLDRIFYKNLELQEAVQFSGKRFRNLSDHLPLLASFSLK
ncbi:MAG: endonuclease/exonuclease/phosphatase family protein [Halobacteriovoraceae bacterium]|nr:endonuclease/exonuclease/phosphatase family protein [Halobacteriovoraceae bacterium]